MAALPKNLNVNCQNDKRIQREERQHREVISGTGGKQRHGLEQQGN